MAEKIGVTPYCRNWRGGNFFRPKKVW